MTVRFLLLSVLLATSAETTSSLHERVQTASSASQLNVAISSDSQERALWLLIRNSSKFAQRYCLKNVTVSGPREGFSGGIPLHSCANIAEFRIVLAGEAVVFVHPFPSDWVLEPRDELSVTTSSRVYEDSDKGDPEVVLNWRGTTAKAMDLFNSLSGKK